MIRPRLLVLTAAVALVGGLIALNWRDIALTWTLLATPPAPPPRTELFAGLGDGDDYRNNERVVAARLTERFPIGAREADLKAYLAAQGLRPGQSVQPGESAFSVRWDRLVCGDELDVYWRVDEAARLTTLRVTSGDTGCP